MSKEIAKRELRFAIHIRGNDYREDTHYIKEQVTYKDGSREPRVYTVTDFERPVWVTSESKRSYNDKKEFEDLENLVSRNTTETNLNRTTAGLLGKPHLANNHKDLKDSPYVYGYDVPSTSFLKLISLRKNEMVQSPYTLCAFDIETTTDEPRDILMVTATLRHGDKIKVHSYVVKDFLKNISNPRSKFNYAMDTYLPDYKDVLDITFKTYDDIVVLLKDMFKVLNELAPDFLSIWNMDFDIRVILEVLEKKNINPVDVICDQKLSRKHRVCRYKRGITKKVMASGKVMPISPAAQWHSLLCTSSFYVIDAMCAYKHLRLGSSEEPSYALDAILGKELNKSKLKFSQADKYRKKEWHDFMQANYPVEYIVYNIYDCLALLELDEKTKDLSGSLPSFSMTTDFAKFNSQSRKLSDALFIFGMQRGRVLGTTPPYREEEEVDDSLLEHDEEEEDYNNPKDYSVLSLDGWIQLLPQSLLVGDGLSIFEDAPHLKSNMRGLVSDVDSVSSYPSATNAANVSKETTVNEMISVTGVPEVSFRQQNLGICLGNVNLLEYFEVMFDMPSIEEMSSLIDEYIN